MSDNPPQIPQVERPRPPVDPWLGSLEKETLDKLARSPSLRAVHEHAQHVFALNNRIDVLQSKLDRRESELHLALPRVAELEQAQRTFRVDAVVEPIGTGVSAAALSVASFVANDSVKYGLIGVGLTAAAFAMLAKILFAAFGWPKPREKPTVHS